MANIQQLSKAPIHEAIIDFRVKAKPVFNPEEFRSLVSVLKDTFPQVNEQRSMHLAINEKETKKTDTGLNGLFFKTSDNLEIAQYRSDGFTFNRLKPYTSWDLIFPKALELWKHYLVKANPDIITRIALRYINRIDITNYFSDLQQIMAVPPILPASLPQEVNDFLTRVTIHKPGDIVSAHIIQAIEKNTTLKTCTLIFDIDTYIQKDIETNDPNIPELFNKLRDYKNQIFFSFLTEKMIEDLK